MVSGLDDTHLSPRAAGVPLFGTPFQTGNENQNPENGAVRDHEL